MLSTKEKGLLINIIKHCEKIETKILSLTREQFDQDEDVREIICFNMFQIGELAKNFEPEFLIKYNAVPWKQIKGMRDIIGHGYGSININKVWETALTDIKPLKEYCQKILKDNN